MKLSEVSSLYHSLTSKVSNSIDAAILTGLVYCAERGQAIADSLWTIEQTAEYLNVSVQTVRRMVSSGEIESARIKGRGAGAIRLRPEIVRAYVAEVSSGHNGDASYLDDL